MRIALDARMVKQKSEHGISRYVCKLLEEFKNLATEHQIFVFTAPQSPLWGAVWPKNIKLVKSSTPWISVSEQFAIPYLLKKYQIDLFHSPSFVAPLYCPSSLVMTIHDLNHLALPHFYSPIHKLYYHSFVKTCVQKAKFILTVSHFSKAEIIRSYSVDPSQVIVIHNGVAKQRVLPDLDFVKNKYSLPDKFILCFASKKEHKNTKAFIRACGLAGVDLPVVLIGECDELDQVAASFGVRIVLRGFVEEVDLASLYSLSSLFAYPSLYEGFGLPPLEALACGTQVLVSCETSLPEVLGAHARYMNPHDCYDMAKVLREALHSSPNGSGEEHVKKFSWENAAKKTLSAYDNCFSSV